MGVPMRALSFVWLNLNFNAIVLKTELSPVSISNGSVWFFVTWAYIAVYYNRTAITHLYYARLTATAYYRFKYTVEVIIVGLPFVRLLYFVFIQSIAIIQRDRSST